MRNGNKLLVVIFLAMFILGCSLPVFAEDSAATFKAKCAMCHGADGAGKTVMGAKFNIPDLRAPEIQKLSATELGAVITKGKNKMPAFEGKLTPAEIASLAGYIQHLKK